MTTSFQALAFQSLTIPQSGNGQIPSPPSLPAWTTINSGYLSNSLSAFSISPTLQTTFNGIIQNLKGLYDQEYGQAIRDYTLVLQNQNQKINNLRESLIKTNRDLEEEKRKVTFLLKRENKCSRTTISRMKKQTNQIDIKKYIIPERIINPTNDQLSVQNLSLRNIIRKLQTHLSHNKTRSQNPTINSRPKQPGLPSDLKE